MTFNSETRVGEKCWCFSSPLLSVT